MITVEKTDSAVLVTIPKGDIPVDRLNAILDWLRLEAVSGRSALREHEAEQIAEEMKASWWAENKGRFIKSAM
jgi:hypothetical protein